MSLNTKIKVKPTVKKPKYPCLKKMIGDDVIALFISKKKCTIIYSRSLWWDIGERVNGVISEDFEPFNGEVTIIT